MHKAHSHFHSRPLAVFPAASLAVLGQHWAFLSLGCVETSLRGVWADPRVTDTAAVFKHGQWVGHISVVSIEDGIDSAESA